MKTIWKYTIEPECEIMIPRGAVILNVQTQNCRDTQPYEAPQLWALVDPGAEKEKRSFRTYGTGHEVPDMPGDYVGTFQLSNGTLVFHVFETTHAEIWRNSGIGKG